MACNVNGPSNGLKSDSNAAASSPASGIQSDGDSLIKLSVNKSLVGYFSALLNADVDSAITYVHPLVFRRMQTLYPAGTDVKAELKKSMTDDRMKAGKLPAFIIDISRLSNRIEYKANLMYVVTFNLNFELEGKKYTMRQDRMIAISTDLGEEWKFIPTDSGEVAEILKQEFPERITQDLIEAAVLAN
ncbi:MAG: hypothetical protein K8H89_05230 [Flavobacteriales bacterium]|nr:hypothetical protein [Flavobacteriales bacterium]